MVAIEALRATTVERSFQRLDAERLFQACRAAVSAVAPLPQMQRVAHAETGY
jgi:hypothetical protein